MDSAARKRALKDAAKPERLDAAAAYRAARSAGPGSRIVGWKLDPHERSALLEQFPPSYFNVDADHVTLAAHVSARAPLPGEEQGMIVGRADDGKGVEALVVSIADSTDRPDGSTYHITWSLDRARGRKPVESNDVIASHGWTPFQAPVQLRLRPSLWGRR